MGATWSQLASAALPFVLALVFLVSGAVKLAWPGDFTQLFHLNLYPRWFSHVVAAAELAGAGGLLFARTRAWATVPLIAVTAGAVWTKLNIESGDAAWLIELPLVLLLLLAIVLVRSFPWDGDRPIRAGRRPPPLPPVPRRQRRAPRR